MQKYLRIYPHLLSFSLKKVVAYPQDFVAWFLVDVVWTLVGLGFFKVLFLRLPVISGWTFNELTLVLGFANIVGAFMWGLMYNNMKQLVRNINKGDLDLYLTKPIDSQFLVSTKEISLSLLPKFLTGTILLAFGLTVNAKLDWSSGLVILVSLISATFICYAIYFASVTCVLLFGRLMNIAEILPHALDTASYPVTIYSTAIQFVFTFILPFALMAFVPASIILGRINYFLLLALPLVAIIFLSVSHFYWSFALRHYSSASS